MEHKIGAHVSISGGYLKALERIIKIGGNCLQIFSTSPRGWNTPKIDLPGGRAFKQEAGKLKIDPIYFHASYLVNLADEGKGGHLSKQVLIAELKAASLMGVKGSIVHLGSFKNDRSESKYKTLIRHIKEVLKDTPDDTLFMMENAGNNKIGQTLDEIAQIIKDVNNGRMRICLDTCHLFSAGYDLRTKELLEKFIAEFDTKIGLDKIEVWHFNDNRDPFSSFRDRHENIGMGSIGLDEFKLIMNHPKFKTLPFIIETPGFDSNGPDKKNIDILKGLL